MRMKSLGLLMVTGAAVTFAPLAWAAPPEKKGAHEDGPRGGRDSGRMMSMLPVLSALDADKDGTISSDEIENASAALGELDKNDDGKLDRSELRPDFAGRSGPPRGSRHASRDSGRRWDRDGDRNGRSRDARRGDARRHDSRGRDGVGRRDRGRNSFDRDAHHRSARGRRAPEQTDQRHDARGRGGRDAHGHAGDGRDAERGPESRKDDAKQRVSREKDKAKQADKPRDSKPSKPAAGPRQGSPIMERLLSLDKDGDGELSKDELADLPVGGQRLLKAGDGNEDGALSSDELSTLKERGQDFWKQRRERAEQSE
ncbi:hypothetical protein [Allorhodopirellula solitaria]|nr:hypothetical protein [Allorhodopirellula solitaria]